MRLALLAAVLAVIAGVPVWLEAVLWMFLVGVLVWVRVQRMAFGATFAETTDERLT